MRARFKRGSRPRCGAVPDVRPSCRRRCSHLAGQPRRGPVLTGFPRCSQMTVPVPASDPRVAEGPRRSSGGPPVGQRMLVTRPVRAGPAAATPCGATGGVARPSSAPISALSPEATAAEITRPGVVSVGRPFTGRLGPRGFRAWSRAHRASHLSGPMKCPVRAGWALQFGYPPGRLQVPQPHRDRPDHLARRGPAAATAPTRRRSRPVTRPSARLTTRDPGRPRLCRSQVGTVAAPVPARTVIRLMTQRGLVTTCSVRGWERWLVRIGREHRG